jgi:hypothetical protein
MAFMIKAKHIFPLIVYLAISASFNHGHGQYYHPEQDDRLITRGEKGDTAVSIVSPDTLSVPSFFDFNLPVIMQTGYQVSAITLGLYFPEEYLEIKGMIPSGGMTGYSYNITDSLFNLVWSDVNPIDLTDGDTLIILQMRSLDLAGLTGTIQAGIDELSEFADQNANVIEGVVLDIPGISYLIPDTNEFITGIYPNPFDDFISINFYLKAESQVKISLFNVAGMEINQMTDAVYPEGSHQVKLYALDLSKGIYLLAFTVKNDEQSSIKVNKIISIR